MSRLALLPFLLAIGLPATAVAATIIGTPHADVLVGTPQPDTIWAAAGNDRIDTVGGGADVVHCGRGVDLAVVDRADRVAADCETVSRQISSDPFTDPGTQHATALEPASLAFGRRVVAVYQVGRSVTGGATTIGFATSADGGRSWTNGFLPGLTVASRPRGAAIRASDPSVGYDAAHGVWLVSTLLLTTAGSEVVVSRSSDGVRWSLPVLVRFVPASGDQPVRLDKEWVSCDDWAASPALGRCAVLYADDVNQQLSAQLSSDGGQTWSAPAAAANAIVSGAQPVWRPDGALVVVGASDDAVYAAVSRAGDGSFQPAVLVAAFLPGGAPGMRAPVLPSAEVDAAGTVFAAWQDGSAIVVARSADGAAWSAPQAVPLTAPGGSAFIPGLGVDPARVGRLALVAYTYANGACQPARCRLNAVAASSSDGGATWTAPRRLNALPMPLGWLAQAGGRMVGDYVSTAFATGRAVSVFTLAERPTGHRLREQVFAATLAVP